MAKEKDEIDLDDMDNDFDKFLEDDLDWGGFEELTDGSENKKNSRKPIDALRNALGEGLKDNQSKEAYIEEAKKQLPNKFSVVYDDAETYIRSGQELFEESHREIKQSVNKFKTNANRLVKAYDKILPGPLAKLLDKITKTNKEEQEEFYRRQEESNEQLIANEIGQFTSAQLELQRLAESREILRDKQEEKRFETQQELLYNISTGIQRQTAQEEQIAFKQRNKLIEIGYHQLYTQRAIQKSLLESSNHTKQALDSIVKNTALPDIVKSKNMEIMKDMFLRRTMEKVGGKMSTYISGFKDNLISNATNIINEKVNNVTGGLNTASDMMGMIADAKETMAGFEEPKSRSEMVAGWTGSLISKLITSKLTNSAINRLDKTGKLSGLIEGSHRNVKFLGSYLNNWKAENADSHNLKGLLASLIPGTSEDTLSHDLSARYNLTKQAEFDNASRRSIVDVIPQLLAKIHQSTEGIRYTINPNSGPLDDGQLLEWDNDTATLNTRKRIDDRTYSKLFKLTKQDRQYEYALKLVNLIDSTNILEDKTKKEFAKEIMGTLGERRGFRPMRFLDPDYKWKFNFTEDEKDKLLTLIYDQYNSSYNLDKKADKLYQRFLYKSEEFYQNMETLRGESQDRIYKESLNSDTDIARMRRLKLATFNNGNFKVDNNSLDTINHINHTAKKYDNINLSHRSFQTDLSNDDEFSIDTSEYAFRNMPGYEDAPDGGLGKIKNPRPKEFMYNPKTGTKKEYIDYKEWLAYLELFGRADLRNQERLTLSKGAKKVGDYIATGAEFFNYDAGNRLRNTIHKGVDNIEAGFDSGVGYITRKSGLDKLGNFISEGGKGLYNFISDGYYNKQFDVFTQWGTIDIDSLTERAKYRDPVAIHILKMVNEGKSTDEIKAWIDSQIKAGRTNAPDFKSVYTNTSNKAKDIWEEIKTSTPSKVEEIKEFIKDPEKIKDKKEEILEVLKENITEGVETVKEAIDTAIESEIVKHTEEKLNTFAQTTDDFINNTLSTVNDSEAAKKIKESKSFKKLEKLIEKSSIKERAKLANKKGRKKYRTAVSKVNNLKEYALQKDKRISIGESITEFVKDHIPISEDNNDSIPSVSVSSIEDKSEHTFGKSPVIEDTVTEGQRARMRREAGVADDIDTTKVFDVYIEGEEDPRLLFIEIIDGYYRTVETSKQIKSPYDIDSAVQDQYGRTLIDLRDVAENRLVTVNGEHFLDDKNIKMANSLLNDKITNRNNRSQQFAKMSSMDLTQKALGITFKPFEKLHKYFYKAMDVYLRPENNQDEPRLIMTRFGMIRGQYMTKDKIIIDGVDKINGAVYNAKTGEVIATEEEMLRACDSQGRTLSSNYFVRRFRLAKDLIKKTMWSMPKALLKGGVKASLGLLGLLTGEDLIGILRLEKEKKKHKFLNKKNNLKARFNKLKFWKDDKSVDRSDEYESLEKVTSLREEQQEFYNDGYIGRTARTLGKLIPKRLKDKLKFKPNRIDGVVVDEKTGNKRANNYQDEMKRQDDYTKARDASSTAAHKAELERRAQNDKKKNSIMDFLSTWFGKIFGRAGMLATVFSSVLGLFGNKLLNGLGGLFGKSVLSSVLDEGLDTLDKNKNKPSGNKPTNGPGGKKGWLGRQISKVGEFASRNWTKVKNSSTATVIKNSTVGKTIGGQLSKLSAKIALRAGITAGAGAATLGIGAVLVGAAMAAWTAYDVLMIFKNVFTSPNKVEEFKIAAYGVDPNNTSRASTVLELEEWMVNKTKINKAGTLEIPDIMTASKEKDKTLIKIIAKFFGKQEHFESLPEDEKDTYVTRFRDWVQLRFNPVFYQHAISLHQINPDANLTNAFGRFGKLKDGLVYPWLRRAYFKPNDPENPYNYLYDPFLSNEDDDEDTIKQVGQDVVDKYYNIVVEAYKEDEEDLRKDEQSRVKYNGKSKGYFDFETKTTRYSKENAANRGLLRSTSEEAVKRNVFNKDFSVAKTELIGNTVYLLEPIENVNLDGRSTIDDGDAIRLRMYGLNSLVENRVKALLALEKEMMSYITFSNGNASFGKFNFNDIASKYGALLNWNIRDQEELGKFKAWFEHRFAPTILAFANIVNQRYGTKDILNFMRSDKINHTDKYEIYVGLAGTKTFYAGNEYYIWDIPFQVVNGLDVNTSSGTIADNIRNLEQGITYKVLTEKSPSGLGNQKEPSLNTNSSNSSSGNSLSPTLPNNPLSNMSNAGGSFGTNSPSSTIANTGPVMNYKASKRPDKVKLAKVILEEINQLGWSEAEKNHFLSQITHESGGLKYLEESGDDSYFARKSYGQKWKGRGIIQLTHEYNYRAFAKWANRPDILENPQLVAEDPVLAVKSAIWWWENKKKENKRFREAVNTDDVLAVSKGVNGVDKNTGMPNHYKDRLNQYGLYKSGKGVIREMAGALSGLSDNAVTDTMTSSSGNNNVTPSSPTNTPDKPVIDTSSDESKRASLLSGFEQLETNKVESYTGPLGGFKEYDWNKPSNSNATRIKQATYGTSEAPQARTSGSHSVLESTTNAEASMGVNPENAQAKTVVVPGNPMHKVTITKAGMALLAKATPELVNLGKQYIVFSGNGGLIQGMIPEFMLLFYAAVGDYVKSTSDKTKFEVYSAFRSHEKQKQLYAEAMQKNGGKPSKFVAKPGGSMHEYGIAMDITNTGRPGNSGKVAKAFTGGLLTRWEKWGSKEKWGFYRRLRPGMNTIEDWHVENVHFLKNGKSAPGQTADGDIRGNNDIPMETPNTPASSSPVYQDTSFGGGQTGGSGAGGSWEPNTPNNPTGMNPLTEQQKSQINAENVVGRTVALSGQILGGYTDANNQSLITSDIQSQLNNQSLISPRTSELSSNKVLQYQNKIAETQQKKMMDLQKEQSENISNILSEQLTVQKSIDGNILKILDYIKENNINSKEKHRDNEYGNMVQLNDRLNRPLNKNPDPAIRMNIGTVSIA